MNVLMRLILIAGVFIGCFLSPLSSTARDLEGVSEKQLQLANEAIKLMSEALQNDSGSPEFLLNMSQQWEKVMQALSSRSGNFERSRFNKTEGKDLKIKLIFIAHELGTNPSRFKEIRKEYIYGINSPNVIVPTSPNIKKQHLKESFRWVWEYFLLRPRDPYASTDSDLRVLEGIEAINHPNSLLALDNMLGLTVDSKVAWTRALQDRQHYLLGSIGRFPGEKGLYLLFKNLDKMLDQKRRILATARGQEIRSSRFQPQQYVLKILSDRIFLPKGEQWREVVLDAPVARLSRENRILLKQAQEYWKGKSSE